MLVASLIEWIKSRTKILHQKKGTERARGEGVGRQPGLERQLHNTFQEARKNGKIIGSQWFIQHGKAKYQSLYPSHIIQDEVTRAFEYLGFRFLNG